MNTNVFAIHIKDLRVNKRLSLRDFCLKAGLDPSNWSKVERGVNLPPGDIETLEKVSAILELRGESKQQLFDEAAVARKEIPADLQDNQIFMTALPAFFRSARGHALTTEEIQSLAQDIKDLHTRDA